MKRRYRRISTYLLICVNMLLLAFFSNPIKNTALLDQKVQIEPQDFEKGNSKCATVGEFVLKWGSFGSGDGQFGENNGIAINGSGFVYVADNGYNRVQVFTPTGQFLFKWGGSGSGDGQFWGYVK